MFGFGHKYFQAGGSSTGIGAPPSGFDPSQLTSLATWWDFSDSSTINGGTVSDGDGISQVLDKSGNGATIEQATAIRQWTYKESIQNGLSVGQCTSNDDHMLVISGKKSVTAFLANVQNEGYCIFWVGRNNNATASPTILSSNYYSNSKGITLTYTSANSLRAYHRSSSDMISAVTNSKDLAAYRQQTYLNRNTSSTSNSVIKWNGTQEGTGTTTTTSSGDNIYDLCIGNRSNTSSFGFFNGGGIAEMIICDWNITDNEVLQVEDYLKTKWGL